VFHRDKRVLSKSRRILDGVQFRRPRAVEDRVEPVIPLQALGGAVLVLAQGNHADAGAALDLDKPDFDERLRVFGMRPPTDQVETSSRGTLFVETVSKPL